MNRRSLFKSLAKSAAIIALAPQLAFRARALTAEVVEREPELKELLQEIWNQPAATQAYVLTTDPEQFAAWQRGDGPLFIPQIANAPTKPGGHQIE